MTFDNHGPHEPDTLNDNIDVPGYRDGIENHLRQFRSDGMNEFAYESVTNVEQLKKYLSNDTNAIANVKKYIEEYIRDKVRNLKNIDESDIIDALIDIEIKKLAQKYVLEYQNLQNTCTKHREKWFKEVTDPAKVTILENRQKELTFSELKESTMSARKMKEIFQKDSIVVSSDVFNVRSWAETFHQLPVDFDKLDNVLASKITVEQDEFFKSLEIYAKTGFIDEGAISVTLEAIDKTDVDKVRNVLSYFFPTVSFAQLSRLGILSREDIKKIAMSIYEKIVNDSVLNAREYDSLSYDFYESDNFQWFIDQLQSKNWQIPTDAPFLSGAMITKFFINNGGDGRLSQLISSLINEQQEQKEKEKEKIITAQEMQDFLKANLTDSQKAKLSTNNISEIDELKDGAYVTLDLPNNKKAIWCIKNIETSNSDGIKGLLITSMELQENLAIGGYDWREQHDTSFLSYDKFINAITDKLSASTTNRMEISQDYPDSLLGEDILEMTTLDELKTKVDEIDPDNIAKGFGLNTSFTVKIGNRIEYLSVHAIDEASVPKTIVVRAFDGNTHTLSWGHFIDVMSEGGVGFSRVGNISSPQGFAENAFISGKMFGDSGGRVNKITKPLEWYNSEISCEDNNGEKVKVWGFRHPTEPIFLEVEFGPAGVEAKKTFYSSDIEEAEKGNLELKTKFFTKKGRKKYETLIKEKKRRMSVVEGVNSYESLLQYISDEGLYEPIPEGKEDPVDVYEDSEVEKEKELLEGGNAKFKKGKGNRRGVKNVGELILLAKLAKKSFEESRESKHKLAAAESLHALFSNTLGESSNMARMALQEFTSEVGSLIDGKMNKIRQLKGGEMRKELQGILLTRPPKPVDILAAAIVTVEMAGHLYPDTYLQELQGKRYIWFEQICLAIGLDPSYEMRRCLAKAKKENAESAHHINEVDLIERLFKMNQSNKYIQAINGGPKFWKAAPKGRAEQTEKGKSEAAEFSAAPDRAEYVVAKMKSNEYEISLGAMGPLADKGHDSREMGVAFVWSASNGPNTVHKRTTNDFKNIFYGGNSFHGFCFGKNKESSDLYKGTIIAALEYRYEKGMPGAEDMLNEYREISSQRDANVYAHNENIIDGLWAFWKKNYKILHPILQGTDPLLATMINDNDIDTKHKVTVQKYLATFGEEATIVYPTELKGGFKDYLLKDAYQTYQIDNSFIYFPHPTKAPHRTLGPMLSALSFDPYTKALNGLDREMIWKKVIVGYLEFLRNNETYCANPDFQREQFKILYAEIMGKVAEKMNGITKEEYDIGLENGTFKFMNLLKPFDFDISYESLFRQQRGEKWEDDVDIVFHKFMTGKNRGSQSELVQQNIKNRFGTLRFDKAA